MSPIDEKKMTGTQQRIIDAALHLISHVGYKSTTTKLIAQEAHVNETTIFKNFKSKEALMDTAFKQHANQIKEEVDVFFSQPFSSTRELLEKTGYFIEDIYSRHRDVVIGSIKEVGNEKAQTIFTYKQEYINHSLCQQLQRLSDHPNYTKSEYETLCFIFNNSILALLIRDIRHDKEDTLTHVTLDSIIQMMLQPFKD
ncbi:TetR/AcrR family transcriptional regulator [Carnobacterium divergens]|uniref:TetR/AcrR family transcriptional regulator n=1 Tax=Carnobacterium divergens TaxID=2748 RepID=UPI001EE237A9|nr:TetR/AcrR family transcriptional regulator [Carnobacterium divergens]